MTLNHVRGGAGEPLLLIHGIGGTWRVWEPLIGRLGSSRDVVAIDAPGFGDSAPLAGDTMPSMPALARAIAAWVRREVSGEPIDVAGHSMGGWIALELAKRGVARRSVAVDPAGFWNRWEAEYARAQLRAGVWAARERPGVIEWLARRPGLRSNLLAGRIRGRTGATAAQTVDMFARLGASPGYDATLAAMTSDRFSGGKEVSVPVTIVWGTHDSLLLPRQAERAAAEVPGSELLWVEGGGHFAHWDDPDLVLRAILSG